VHNPNNVTFVNAGLVAWPCGFPVYLGSDKLI
jgi:hypothetical protein